MKADGHKSKANEIKGSLEELLPDKEGNHVVAILKKQRDMRECQ